MTLTQEELYKAIKMLTGDIKPKGCARRDEEILQNMTNLCGVVENLLTDIDDVAYSNRDSHEHSVKEVVKVADKFVKQNMKE